MVPTRRDPVGQRINGVVVAAVNVVAVVIRCSWCLYSCCLLCCCCLYGFLQVFVLPARPARRAPGQEQPA